MLKLINKFRKEEDGASLIEYSLLVGLISIAVILAITAISGNLKTIWTNTSSAVNTAAG
jgi:pilus assembly protein Flp/PilA